MRSAFSSQRPSSPISAVNTDETYDLRGLNLTDPDATMPLGETPFTINSRGFARDDGDSQVANRTRKGASRLSTPIGETLNVQNVATSTGDVSFGIDTVVAQPFTPSASGSLTKLSLSLRKATGATGHIIVEVYTDSAGAPKTLVGQGSILANTVTTSFQDLTCYFIDAPDMTNGTQYWVLVYTQDNGSGTYYLNKTATAGALTVTFTGTTVTGVSALGCSFRYKTYLSTTGEVKGWHLRYPSTGSNLIMVAHGTSIYGIPKSTGVPASLDSGLSASATYTRFAEVEDKTIWVNGFDQAHWYDGSTTSTVGNVPSTAPKNVIIYQNRAFYQTDVTRVDFSDLGAYSTFTSTNFFYVPSPKSPDHMTGWVVFQDDLHIFTHETKHRVTGTDLTTFTRKEAVGTKGAVSQEAIAVDRNFIYFMADDGQIYRYNGSSDQLISGKVFPRLNSIVNKSDVRLDIYNNQLRVYFGQSPSAFNNQMLLLDLESQQWYEDTGHPVQGSTNLFLDNNELVEFSSLTGAVYYGETDDSDLGKMIDWKYWTNYKTYAYRSRTGHSSGGASSKKRIKRFRPIIRTVNADYTMLVGKDIDFANNPDMREYIVSGGGVKWGQFVWGDGTVWGRNRQVDTPSGMSGRGKHVQYRFQRKGVETPVELYGYIAQYVVGRQK